MRPLTLKDVEKPRPAPKALTPKRQISERQIIVRPKRWWEKESIKYAFSHPHVRARLEKLMGNNMVHLTDRAYMQKLVERIVQDYAIEMEARFAVRQADEEVRVKNLVLSCKIKFEDAPPEMAYHPVMLIEQFCNKVIAERRAKIKHQQVHIPQYLYWDDTPDPPSAIGITMGHRFRGNDPPLCVSAGRFLSTTEEEEIELKHMFTPEDYEMYKFTDEGVYDMDDCETVEEMYELAEELIGELKTLPKE